MSLYGHEFYKLGSLSILAHPNHGAILSALFPGIKPREYIFSVNKFCYKIEFIKHHEIDGDGFFFSLITDQS